MNTPKLPPLPCPFCGNEPKVVDDLITFHVECTNCGSTGSVSSYESGAISEWNRRAAIEAQGVPDAQADVAQQAKPQPLSDKEADRMTERFYLNGRPVPALYRLSLVRATERHHGIKE